MMSEVRAAVVGILVATVVGCAGTPGVDRKASSSADSIDSVSQMLNKGIMQLTVNVEGLTTRMAELQRLPEVTDPTLRELRALDLSGWQLHQQQWKLQLEHLLFTRKQLRLANESPADRSQLLQQWAKRQQEYERALDDLRQQRLALEQKRVQVEAQLIERSLRGEKE